MLQSEIEELLAACKNAQDRAGFAMSEMKAAEHKLASAGDELRAAHATISVLKDVLLRAHRRSNPGRGAKR